MLHAKLAPSSAARRVTCPGSRALEEKYPETVPSVSSKEGTAAHWVASEYLNGRYSMPPCAPNGEPITKEMLEGADLYEHEIKWLGGQNELHIEERVDISNVHDQCWGTPDCWFVVDSHLYLFDYKFGHGYVEVFENWQLLEYAAGIAQKVQFSKVTMTIVQPRCYMKNGPVNSWTILSPELYTYIGILQKAEQKAMAPEALCIPSSECTHCLGRHVCAALQKTVGKFMDVANENASYELTPVQTGYELKHLRHAADMIEARLTAIEEQARSMIMRGEYVPGFKLQPGQGREHWTKDASEIITLGELMGLNLAKPAEAITPVQARKIGIHEDILKQYSQRIPGKLKLVEETDSSKVFKK
jgi:hypothetical protein